MELGDDLRDLKEKGHVSSKSTLSKLGPHLDSKGIMRVNGRVYGSKKVAIGRATPIILPKGCHFTAVVIRDIHIHVIHHVYGAKETFAEVRKKFWIIGGLTTVKNAIGKCVICTKTRPRALIRQEGPLPEVRLPPEVRPRMFDTVAMDLTGHYLVKGRRGHQKSKWYLCVFICQVYRAVHIEIVKSLDTASILMALTRLCAKYNRPSRIRSDNASMFGCADRQLRKILRNLKKTREYQDQFPDIKWEFSAVYVPSTNGLAERAISSTKTAVKAILGTGEKREDEFETGVSVANAIINNHPIASISSDPRDPKAICVNDFLKGSPYDDLAPMLEDFYPSRERWHELQKDLDLLWKRFQIHHLTRPTLLVGSHLSGSPG